MQLLDINYGGDFDPKGSQFVLPLNPTKGWDKGSTAERLVKIVRDSLPGETTLTEASNLIEAAEHAAVAAFGRIQAAVGEARNRYAPERWNDLDLLAHFGTLTDTPPFAVTLEPDHDYPVNHADATAYHVTVGGTDVGWLYPADGGLDFDGRLDIVGDCSDATMQNAWNAITEAVKSRGLTIAPKAEADMVDYFEDAAEWEAQR